MDPRYVEVFCGTSTAIDQEGVTLGCTQCETIIFQQESANSGGVLLFDLVRSSLRHSCASVEKVTQIIRDSGELN